MLPIKKGQSKIAAGIYNANFYKFDALDPKPEHARWNPTGKLKMLFRDENNRIHETMLTFPNYVEVLDETPDTSSDDFKNAMTLSREVFAVMSSVYCVTQEEFNNFVVGLGLEDLMLPSDLANLLNVFAQQAEATGEACDSTGTIIVHNNKKGYSVPYTYSANELIQGKITHIIVKDGEILGLGTVTVSNNSEYINFAIPNDEGLDVAALEFTESQGAYSQDGDFWAYPLNLDQEVLGWIQKTRIWSFQPFFTGETSELTLHNAYNYKGEAIIEGRVTRITEYGARLYCLTSFNAG